MTDETRRMVEHQIALLETAAGMIREDLCNAESMRDSQADFARADIPEVPEEVKAFATHRADQLAASVVLYDEALKEFEAAIAVGRRWVEKNMEGTHKD